MDAKSKANFINSVAAGKEVVCPACKARNSADSKTCATCGFDLQKGELSAAKAPVSETQGAAEKYVEPEAVFAKGLPAWDITPPQIVVRRR